MTGTTSLWNTETAANVLHQLTKVANDMLDTAAPEASPSGEAAGTAGPQEVVDALAAIIGELEQISAAIPAEASQEQSPMGAPVAQPEEPKVAQLQTLVAELTQKVESQEREKVAEQYADLFDEPKVQQAKYDEVISSKEKPSFWTAKIEAISTFQKEAGVKSYKPAQQTTSWIQPRTKIAQQGSEIVRL